MSAPVAELRSFNRFYTRQIGLLNEHLLESPFTLAEARILYELAHQSEVTAADLSRSLGMDKAQLSRMLARFTAQDLIASTISPTHAKHRLLSLTDAGRAAASALEASADAQMRDLLAPLDGTATRRLTDAMQTVQRLLSAPATEPSFILRAPNAGDLGHLIKHQALLYAREYQFDWTFEGLLADVVGHFVAHFDPVREQGWIAECGGAVAGSVFLMRGSEPATAKLRLLYVDESVRGRGIGKALVGACIARAKEIGYERISLWTQDCLHAARAIYAAAGFKLVDSEPHRSFGCDLVGETWALDLAK
jgi:DNA-binding MarR family transcriptional regulator/GNAT superfamily N-acetyltransferase